jgi:hypothetical protein
MGLSDFRQEPIFCIEIFQSVKHDIDCVLRIDSHSIHDRSFEKGGTELEVGIIFKLGDLKL